MTPQEFKSIRLRAGLTQRQLAERLRVSDHRTIRRYETGEREISGPVSLLMAMIDTGELAKLEADRGWEWARIAKKDH